MRKAIALSAAAALTCILAASNAGPAPAGGSDSALGRRVIRIATEGAYGPWNATDASGKLVGFEPDLASELCRRMQLRCEVVAQDWSGMIPALMAGAFDAIMAGMSITEERMKAIDFAGPYATEPSSFGTRGGHPLASTRLDLARVNLAVVGPAERATLDALAKILAGRIVGVQTGTIQAAFMAQHLPAVTTRTYDRLDAAALDVVAGRIDAVFGARSAVSALAKEDGAGHQMVLFGLSLARGPLGAGVGVGLRKGDADLKARFERAIAEAAADGTTAALSRKWFGYDVSIRPTGGPE